MVKIYRIIGIVTVLVCVGLSGCNEQQTPSNNNHRIQQMINNASDGDTIYVSNGTYYENIIINKSLTLLGEDRNTTVINGGGDNVVRITADNCSFEGFTVTNTESTNQTIGIDINANNTTIENNTISSNIYGICFTQTSTGNNIFYNNFSQNTYGLYVSSYSKKNIIGSNIFFNNKNGIYLAHSNYNIIIMNNISCGEYGIFSTGSVNNNISDNNIFSNSVISIYLSTNSHRNNVSFNIISNSSCGIRLAGAQYNYVYNNCIYNNQVGLYPCCGTNLNYFYNNTLLNNSRNAYEKSGVYNRWYNSQTGIGNYWDDYTGSDENHDGIGDTPYEIPGSGNQDIYPLMTPLIDVRCNE